MLEPFARSRVLVVDDNLASVSLVQSVLNKFGLPNVEAVTDPREVLARVAEFGPDVVLLDLHMPRVDGYSVLTQLRETSSATELPVLVLSADTTREATRRALSLGANDFLTKPLDAAEITLRVRNLLEMRAAHRSLADRQRWLEASLRIATELFSEPIASPLPEIARRACELAEADTVVLTVSAPGTQEQVSTAFTLAGAGLRDPALDNVAAVGAALAGDAIRGGRPLVVDDHAATGLHDKRTARLLEDCSAMVLPIAGLQTQRGAISLFRSRQRAAFTTSDLDMAASFVDRAAMALEVLERRGDHEQFLVLQDRHRVARDLHDHVLQHLFATGVSIQAIAAGATAEIEARIGDRVAEMDTMIHQIRERVLQLDTPLVVPHATLRLRLMHLIVDLPNTAIEPHLHFTGRPEVAVPEPIADDVVAFTDEALYTISCQHDARSADIVVELADSGICVEITSDGSGEPDSAGSARMAEIARRAKRRGGDLSTDRTAEGGTCLIWTAPLVRH